MLMQIFRNLDRWLRDHQDPRYRNAPWILPRAWHGSGEGLSDDDYKRLNLNVRDIGLDSAVISQQAHNKLLQRMGRQSDRSV